MNTLVYLLVFLFWFSSPPVFSESIASTVIKFPPPAFEVEHTRSNPRRSSRVISEKYKSPMIDTHVHLDPPLPRDHKQDRGIIGDRDIDIREIVEVIKAADVEFAIFMPTPNEGREDNHEVGAEQKKRLLNLDKNRIRLFCGSNYITYWLHRAYYERYSEEGLKHIIKHLSNDLDSGAYAGVGEIGIYHFNKHGSQPVIEYPPDFQPFLRIVEMVANKGAWLDIHAEPVDPDGKSYESQVFGGIELLFHRYPNLKLILSHTAMTHPTNARKILIKYPNVMMNIKIIMKHNEWRNLEPVTNPKGELYEDWAQLFEEMPEKFMIGTDAKFGREGFEVSKYKKEIEQMRRILGALNPNAARLIAHENAQKIFK